MHPKVQNTLGLFTVPSHCQGTARSIATAFRDLAQQLAASLDAQDPDTVFALHHLLDARSLTLRQLNLGPSHRSKR